MTLLTTADLVTDGLQRMRSLASTGRLEAAFATGRALLQRLETRSVPATAHLAGANGAEIATELGWLAFQLGTAQSGLAEADRAIALWCSRDDVGGEARARAVRALLDLELGHGERAAEGALAALRIAETSGRAAELSWALNVVGIVFWFCRQHGRAAEFCSRALAIARASGDDALVGLALVNLAAVQYLIAFEARENGDEIVARVGFDRAVATSRDACGLLERTGELAQRVTCLLNWASAEAEIGHAAEADRLLALVDDLPAVDGVRLRLYRAEVAIMLKLQLCDWSGALPLVLDRLAEAERAGQYEALVPAVAQLATIYEHLGQFEQALACLKRRHALEAQVSAERIGDRARTAEIVLGLRQLEAKAALMAREREAIERSYASLTREALALAEDTRRDPLTGIGNRRRLDEAVASLLPGAPVAFAMIDIDRFKSVNDRFSHVVGDHVLRELAHVLSGCCRPGDLLVRFGGEEFALLMTNADARLGRRICHRLRHALRAIRWSNAPADLTVTASFGVAGLEEIGSVEALLALADARLYRAKHAGRDRVVGVGGLPDRAGATTRYRSEAPNAARRSDASVMASSGPQ